MRHGTAPAGRLAAPAALLALGGCGGAILVAWDEGSAGDRPIGLIAVSPLSRPGHASGIPCSHASTLRTIQEVLGVTPLLRGAASAASLADLFTAYP
jgi:hypothetical protein